MHRIPRIRPSEGIRLGSLGVRPPSTRGRRPDRWASSRGEDGAARVGGGIQRGSAPSLDARSEVGRRLAAVAAGRQPGEDPARSRSGWPASVDQTRGRVRSLSRGPRRDHPQTGSPRPGSRPWRRPQTRAPRTPRASWSQASPSRRSRGSSSSSARRLRC